MTARGWPELMGAGRKAYPASAARRQRPSSWSSAVRSTSAVPPGLGHFTFSTDLTPSGRERPLRDPEQPDAPDL